ncbi:MAG: adenylosuccinate synthase [Deltaproteobacteria bacterium]|nr:MAG: adenylosuccinate synthase [Deltaproteobacteria bacterium]
MSADLIVGLQWGDEGKGKVVDLLARKYDFVVRYQGGHNAGHTIVIDDTKYALSLVPSGVLSDATKNIIANGLVIYPPALIKEIEQFQNMQGRLFISSRAHLILDYHIAIDKAKEARATSAIGTTGRGIGPAYADKISRVGMRLGDLLDPDALLEKVRAHFQTNKAYFQELGIAQFDENKYRLDLNTFSQKLSPFITDTRSLIYEQIKSKSILLEGAQGTMLDIDHGTYPFVTSSSTIAAGACIGTGLSPKDIGKVFGIIKAYTTRVGNGPFPTEDKGADGELIAERGAEFGTVTKRKRRCGWFDASAARFAVRINGVDEVCLMKLDVLDGFEKIKVCTHYELNGEIVDDFVDGATCIYKEFKGWDKTQGLTNWDDLPQKAKDYILALEELMGARIGIVSTGPKRSETIFRP